jgi:hypothetical protein
VAWLELFSGMKNADNIRNESYKRRHAIKKDKRKGFRNWLKKENEEWGMELSKMASQIKEKHRKTIQKYEFPSDKILELIYPKFFEESFSHII